MTLPVDEAFRRIYLAAGEIDDLLRRAALPQEPEPSRQVPAGFRTSSSFGQGEVRAGTRAIVELAGAVASMAGKTFLVAGVDGREKKTSIAAALAGELCSTRRTILLDFDLLHPSVAWMLRIPPEPDLADCILAGLPPEEAVVFSQEDGFAAAALSSPGRLPPEALLSDDTLRFFDWAKRDFDAVLVDGGCFLESAATSILATMCDWVILSVRSGAAHERVEEVKRLLDHRGAKLAAAVLVED